MELSDWIQIIAITTSLLISVVSILQTQKSLKITERSIKESSRPYVSIYIENSDISPRTRYFVIKNFGNTSAKILKITFDKELDSNNKDRKFSSLIGGTIAPKQKFTSAVRHDYNETVNFFITYTDSENERYEEHFEVKTDISSSLPWSTPANSKDSTEATAIKQSVHAIIRAFK